MACALCATPSGSPRPLVLRWRIRVKRGRWRREQGGHRNQAMGIELALALGKFGKSGYAGLQLRHGVIEWARTAGAVAGLWQGTADLLEISGDGQRRRVGGMGSLMAGGWVACDRIAAVACHGVQPRLGALESAMLVWRSLSAC